MCQSAKEINIVCDLSSEQILIQSQCFRQNSGSWETHLFLTLCDPVKLQQNITELCGSVIEHHVCSIQKTRVQMTQGRSHRRWLLRWGPDNMKSPVEARGYQLSLIMLGSPCPNIWMLAWIHWNLKEGRNVEYHIQWNDGWYWNHRRKLTVSKGKTDVSKGLPCISGIPAK